MSENNSEQQPAEPGSDADSRVDPQIEPDTGIGLATAEEAVGETAATEPAPEAAPGAEMDDLPPDRLAIDGASPHFDAEKLRRGVGIRFKGTRRTNVEEYCISEGWVRVQAGKAMDRRGRPLTIKLSGPVEAWYEDLGEDAPVARGSDGADSPDTEA